MHLLATLIISVYKNTRDLEAILDEFEIIISEDCQSQEISNFLKTYASDLHIKHLTQEDKGFRKNRALNRAIKAAASNYLIFIDGDCIPNHRFIEQHVKNCEDKAILIGRRPMLGALMSSKILKMKNIKKFTRNYLWNFLTAKKD